MSAGKGRGRRVLLVVGAVLGGALLLAALAAVVLVAFVLPRSRPAVEMTARSTPQAIERGRYLAYHVMVCVTCHSQGDDKAPGYPLTDEHPLAGRAWTDASGALVASNLTPDVETGIGAWTDGELVRAMREGVGRDGRGLFPMMPYMAYGSTLSDDDALAIVAYLRSLPPVRRELPKTKLPLGLRFAALVLPHPVEVAPTRPLPGAPEYGDWLIQAAGCRGCHDQMTEGHDTIAPLGGGQLIDDDLMLYVPNISPEPATGVGAWTDEQILAAIDGVGRSGTPLRVMPSSGYRGMTLDDKRALVAAIRRAKPVVNVVGLPKR